MSSPKKQQKQTPTGSMEEMLDISGIEQEGADRLQNQLLRLQDQLNEVKEELLQKKRQLELKNKTKEALDEQLKTLKTRSQNQEERIKSLQAQLRNRTPLSSEEPESSYQVDKLKESESELRDKLGAIQKELLIERKKYSDLENWNKKLSQEVEQLKRESSQSSNVNQNERQVESLRLQLEQEKSKVKKLTQQVSEFSRKTESLNAELSKALKAQKQAPVVPRVVQTPQKVVEVASKESESEIKRLQTQIHQLNLNLHDKDKTIKSYEKEIKSLRAELNDMSSFTEQLKYKISELNQDLQKARNREVSIQQSALFPSQINMNSNIPTQPIKKADIDAEEHDEDIKIKVKKTHLGIVGELNKHFARIKAHQKISFLNIVASWSEEQQERLQSNINELNEG